MYLHNQKKEKIMGQKIDTASHIEAFLSNGGKIRVCRPQARVSAANLLNKYTARCKDDTIAHRGRKGMNARATSRCNNLAVGM
jgi:hypothetical protein